MAIKSKGSNGHLEGRMYKKFTYFPKLALYPNISDRNELGIMGGDEIKKSAKKNLIILNYMSLTQELEVKL